MSSIIEHFRVLTSIPHCSKKADGLLEYLCSFAKEKGYSVEVDSAKNILIKKGKPKLSLQAHYDMVCMGEAPNITIYENNGWLKAKDSSLGADNGIGIAMMMELMVEGVELEFLLTSDEEIGLIGANALEFELDSIYMLNLDSEDEAEVYIGCAGGVDIVASKQYARLKDTKESYSITIEGLDGGHSGVDIDKGIPNAIKLLASYLKDKKVDIVSIEGGERRNSIPSSAKAIVKSSVVLEGDDIVKVEPIESDEPILYGGKEIVDLIVGFTNGMLEFDYKLEIPHKSINLALISTEGGVCSIESSARAMSTKGIDEIKGERLAFLEGYGYDVSEEDKYPSWTPSSNSFVSLVSDSMEEVFGSSEEKAIHAGLECGVISQKYPNILIASIGPTIRYPHSQREEVNIDSIAKTFEVLKKVVSRV